MPLTYLHPGDVETNYLLTLFLVAGVILLTITAVGVAIFVAILKAVDRRIEKKKSQAAG